MVTQPGDPSAWVYTSGKDYDPDEHESERANFGFSTYDWWNFWDYMAWGNIQALEEVKTGHGFPGDLADTKYGGTGGGMEAWVEELDIMIAGFEAHLTLQNDYPDDKDEAAALRAVYEKGMALYAHRFSSLWD